jgi:hypothetical protein
LSANSAPGKKRLILLSSTTAKSQNRGGNDFEWVFAGEVAFMPRNAPLQHILLPYIPL